MEIWVCLCCGVCLCCSVCCVVRVVVCMVVVVCVCVSRLATKHCVKHCLSNTALNFEAFECDVGARVTILPPSQMQQYDCVSYAVDPFQ